jgi:hypothetical protein
MYFHCLGIEPRLIDRPAPNIVAIVVELPTAAARVRVRAACEVCGGEKRHWGRFSPSTSVSPANHSTDFSIIIITRG